MKYLIILGDGMADEPIGELGNKTPLEAAVKPSMDRLAATRGAVAGSTPFPKGCTRGSEIANLSVLGYDVPAVFEGRGVLEAASMGWSSNRATWPIRCNLICLEENRIKNHSAGHISSGEAAEIIAFLAMKMGNDRIRFYPGVSYRHLLVIKGGTRVWPAPRHTMSWAPLSGR